MTLAAIIISAIIVACLAAWGFCDLVLRWSDASRRGHVPDGEQSDPPPPRPTR